MLQDSVEALAELERLDNVLNSYQVISIRWMGEWTEGWTDGQIALEIHICKYVHCRYIYIWKNGGFHTEFKIIYGH